MLKLSESQDLVYRKSVSLSSDEESFLSHILTLDSIPQRHQKLFEAAEKLYGSRVSKLLPKSSGNFSLGETLLKSKTLVYFKKCIDNSYHSITQMTLNMNKLAGKLQSIKY